MGEIRGSQLVEQQQDVRGFLHAEGIGHVPRVLKREIEGRELLARVSSVDESMEGGESLLEQLR